MDNGFRDRVSGINLPRTSADTPRARERQDLISRNDEEDGGDNGALRLVDSPPIVDEEGSVDFPNEKDYLNYNKARLLKTRHENITERLKHLQLFLKKEPQGDELAVAKEGETEDEASDRLFRAEQARKRREEGLNRPDSDLKIQTEIDESRNKLKEIEATLRFLAPKAIVEGEKYLTKLQTAVYLERKNIAKTRVASVSSTEDMIPDTMDELEFLREFSDAQEMSGTNG